ncbi:MAG: primosomal protein DnaI [Firmicutes bacterium]|nr:primosomal protein DnaI [Bacillota bacterium]
MQKVMDKVSKYVKDDLDTKLKQAFIRELKDEDFKKLVSSLNLPQDKLMKYTSKLRKTTEQLKKCKNCSGLISCENEINGFIYYPEIQNGKLNFSHISCKYKRKFIKDNMYLDNIYSFDIPKDIINAKMKDIYTDDKSRIPVIKWIKDFINDYDGNKKQKGLYLNGNFGSGKTYLISACFNELAKKGVKSAIIYWPEFLRKLKASFNSDNDSFSNLFDRIKTVPLLLIDDIGAENTTPWGRDEILGPILQYRMQQNLTTFFTSNLSLDDLEKHFSVTKESVDVVKSRRILERIKDLTTELVMIGENRRK